MTDEGYVLGSTRVGETQVVVDCLTASGGRRGLVTSGGAHRGALLLPLTLLAFTERRAPHARLPRLADAYMPQPFRRIPFHNTHRTLALELCHLLRQVVPDADTDRALYQAIQSEIRTLDDTPDPTPQWMLGCLMRLTRPLGIQPQQPTDGDPIFDLREARWRRDLPLHGDFVDGHTAQALKQLQQGHTPPDPNGELRATLTRYYQLHLPLNEH